MTAVYRCDLCGKTQLERWAANARSYELYLSRGRGEIYSLRLQALRSRVRTSRPTVEAVDLCQPCLREAVRSLLGLLELPPAGYSARFPARPAAQIRAASQRAKERKTSSPRVIRGITVAQAEPAKKKRSKK